MTWRVDGRRDGDQFSRIDGFGQVHLKARQERAAATRDHPVGTGLGGRRLTRP